ncbi:class I SAM-dependent methyltransferase [Pseudahrensia aquimaris]|uniref:Class I SAM-dependent methyltransferase n=1 Tax=Pseudahrensia aquimaris TaxID=744461 RepID=A0ABW3FA82_9HYPH
MEYSEKVANHYAHGKLLTAIEAGLIAQGISAQNASVEDLAPVDEFHIGGRIATAHFLDQLEIEPSQSILDIGCGLGGSARYAAKTYGAKITGVDLTPEYVETGQALCDWVGLSDRIQLHQGSALSLPFEANSFDTAFMIHVGMNIQNKRSLVAEVSRVLKPRAKFGIYDIMKTGHEQPTYPVPWASTSDTSWLAAPSEYRAAFQDNGFDIVAENNRHEFANEFFKKAKASIEAAGGPPPLGLHVLMQQLSVEKISNMVAALVKNRISPIEMIAIKGD